MEVGTLGGILGDWVNSGLYEGNYTKVRISPPQIPQIQDPS